MSISVSFVLSSKEIDVQFVDSTLNLSDAHIRDDFPPKSIACPEWWIEIKEESLSTDDTIWKIAQRLENKKAPILQLCKQFNITPCLAIKIDSGYADRPEFVISPRTNKFFSELSTEIVVNLESIYRAQSGDGSLIDD